MSQLSIAMFTFWRIWFQNGIISNRAIQGQELVLMVNFSLKSNEDYSSTPSLWQTYEWVGYNTGWHWGKYIDMARRYGGYERNNPHLILKKNWFAAIFKNQTQLVLSIYPEMISVYYQLSTIIPTGMWHCSYHDHSKQTKWGNVVVVDVTVINRNVYLDIIQADIEASI
jgi:hypothetical protein